MSASLSVLVPIEISDFSLVSSTAPEADYPAWSAGITYAVGARCISPITHRVYESLVAGNVGHAPTDIANQAGSTLWWFDVGPTNRWAMLDGEVSTQTIVPSPLTVVVRPGAVTGMFLAGLDATTLSISIKDKPDGIVIYQYDGDLDSTRQADYYEHFYAAYKLQTDFLASGMDPYTDCEVTITLARPDGDVKCGVLVVGELRSLGQTQYGAKAKPKTYSYIKTDEFGNNTIKRRKKARDMTASAFVALSDANSVLDTISDLLDVPCVWIGTDLPEYTGLRVYGLGSAELSYDHPQGTILNLTVQGLI